MYSSSGRPVVQRSSPPRHKNPDRERRDRPEQGDARGEDQVGSRRMVEEHLCEEASKERRLTDMTGPAANGVTAAITEAISATFTSVRLRHERQ